MKRIVVVLVLGMVLAGCAGITGLVKPTAGMSAEQKNTVMAEYRNQKIYRNAVVYSNDPIRHWTVCRRTQHLKLGSSAVWFKADRSLVQYTKLVYTHDQGTGEIFVSKLQSVELGE